MRKFANLIEKYLIRSIVLCLVLLVLVQGMMTKDPLRIYLSWGERLEGQIIEYPVNTISDEEEETKQLVESPYALMTIAIEEYSTLPQAKIIINGEEKNDFTKKEVQLKVMAGDVVEIDSRAYNFPIEYHIIKVSDNLSFPERSKSYTAYGTIVMVGKIIVK